VGDLGPIGLFDSGVGGLSVLRQLQKVLPHEDYVYFADTLHMPYGLRSQAELESIVFSICDFLLRKRCRAIVMACNTSSALVLPHARLRYAVAPPRNDEPERQGVFVPRALPVLQPREVR